jgi:TolB-like protein
MGAESSNRVGAQTGAVFLSYASQDVDGARRICDALRAAGIEVWLDQSELRGGDAWDRTIRDQIRRCALFIPIISAHSQARLEGYFRREWKFAVERKRDIADELPFLLPVVIDETPERGASVPEGFHEVQWTRLPGGAASQEFIQHVSRLLTGHPDAPKPAVQALQPSPAAAPARPTSETKSRSQLRMWLLLIAVATALIVGSIGIDRYVLHKGTQVSATSTTAEKADKSIAVLPFVDLSEKHDQEYFSDGLAEELRDLLAQVPELKVPGRAASFYFKGREVPLANIAKTLGVGHLLEGSVRKAGTKIRVAVELVRADTGYQVWSEHFDRDLKDIFQVQSEIASAVVQALKIRLMPQTLVRAGGTSNIEAYDQYLRGRRLYSFATVESDREAIAHYDRAIALDPNYAAAYAGRAGAAWLLVDDLGREETEEEYRQRMQYTERAIELDPQMSEGYTQRGLARLSTANWAGAREDFEKATSLNPQDSQGWRYIARYYASQHDLAKAIETAGRAIELDRFEPWARFYRARMELAAGTRGPARADLEKALELSHVSPAVIIDLALLDAADGAIATAAKRAETISTDSFRVPLDTVIRCAQGERSSAVRDLDRWIARANDPSPQYVIVAYVRCGKNEEAITVLERYLSAPLHRISDDTVESLGYYAEFAPLRTMPRYQALLRKMNLPE